MEEDAGEINWKSSLGSVSKHMRISSDPCSQLYLSLQMSRGEVAVDFHRAGDHLEN